MGNIISKKIKNHNVNKSVQKKVLLISTTQNESSGSLTPYKSTINTP